MYIKIAVSTQTLTLLDENRVVKQYLISTAKNGVGEAMDSECTPCGRHTIAEKIGDGCEVNSVFVGRRPTRELYAPSLRKRYPERDWIVTRILWLSGSEAGKNKGRRHGNNIDSYERYIYIHGSPDDVAMGQPGSRGCIRMRNEDIIALFNRVEEGTVVNITEN